MLFLTGKGQSNICPTAHLVRLHIYRTFSAQKLLSPRSSLSQQAGRVPLPLDFRYPFIACTQYFIDIAFPVHDHRRNNYYRHFTSLRILSISLEMPRASKSQSNLPEHPVFHTSTTSSDNSRKRKLPGQTKYYAVRAGHRPGVYTEWKDCEQNITKFRGSACK